MQINHSTPGHSNVMIVYHWNYSILMIQRCNLYHHGDSCAMNVCPALRLQVEEESMRKNPGANVGIYILQGCRDVYPTKPGKGKSSTQKVPLQCPVPFFHRLRPNPPRNI